MKQTNSSGGVVVNTNGDVLVVSQHGSSWSLPKGGIEPGEEALAAAQREILEESGISELNFVKELGIYQRFRIGFDGGEDKSELKSISMFLFTTGQMDLDPQDSDNPEARWVQPDQVEDLLTHAKDKSFYTSIYHEITNI